MTKKSNNKKDTVKVDILDLYRLLLSEERYGCSRNNHLMPSCGFDTCRKYVELMLKTNEDIAIHTAQQLCDEVISELVGRFYRGVDDDDENGNRAVYIEFIEWCLTFVHKYKEDWLPYNYDLFVENRAKDDEKVYRIKDLDTGEILNSELLSYNNYVDFILFNLLGGSTEGTCQRKCDTNWGTKTFEYHFTAPKKLNVLVYKEGGNHND